MYETQENREADPTIKHWAVVESGGGGECPVQHWGTLCNGWKFYFRFRSNKARLNVAPPGTSTANVPAYNPDWSFEAAYIAFGTNAEYLVPQCLWPEGRLNEVYPHEPLAGFFLTEDDLHQTFAACLHQVASGIGLEMVCSDCRQQVHDTCKGGTWCDCGHRTPQPTSETETEIEQTA